MSNRRTETFQVAGMTIPRGSRGTGYLKVAEMQDGTPANIPLVAVNGAQGGPTLYVESCLDGAELNPIASVRRILNEVDPVKLSGRIIAALIVNFFGFHWKLQLNPLDNTNLNRVFPGNPAGGPSERIAHIVFNELVSKANYVVDLHQTSSQPSVGAVHVRVGKDEPNHEKAFDLARAFGATYVVDEKGAMSPSDTRNPASLEGRLIWVSTIRGIPGITPELSGSLGWNEESINFGVKGLRNVLKYLKMINGTPELPKRQYVTSKLVDVKASRGGFVEYKAKLGDQIRSGDVFAVMTDVFGTPIELIKSPDDGILWRLSDYPMRSTGERVAMIGTNITEI